MRNILLILTCITFLFAGCAGMELQKNYMDIAEESGGSAISYDSNTSPLETDQLLGIDDPAGTWAINRFPISNLWTSILKGYADALYAPVLTAANVEAALTNDNIDFGSGVVTATGFAGPLTGNVTGDASGSSGSCTGNAATATTAGITPVDTEDENATFYPILVDGATGLQATETDDDFYFNPNTNVLTVKGGIEVPQSAAAQYAKFWAASGDGEFSHTITAGTLTANRQSYWPDYVIEFLNASFVDASGNIEDDVIDSEHYVAGSIDNEHLADDAVNSDEIASGAIDLDHMSAESIDSDQYVDGSIDNAHLSDDAVDSDEIASGAIDLDHLAAGIKSGSDATLITGTKGTNTYSAVWDANGDLVDGPGVPLIAADVDTWAELPALTENYVLLGNGSNQATATDASGWDKTASDDITTADMPTAGTDPDVDAAGEVGRDTDDHSLRGYDGSAQFAYGMKNQPIHVTVVSPNDLADGTRDAFLFWENTSGMSFIVTSWNAKSGTDDTTLNIEETDGDGANNATVDAVEIATDGTGLYYASDSTITAATIENGHMLWLDFDDTDEPTWVKVTINGYYNADVD